MPLCTLDDFVATTAAEFGIPGVAVGVWVDGQERLACHGVTSLDNPLPADRDTLYAVGSVSKSFTATALMRLVADGKIDLQAPVRRYVPELRLTDERAAEAITVLNLLNHTAGLDWRILVDTGEGDDALAAYVAHLADFDLIAPPGTRASYSQAGYNLAGRVLENATSMTFERAIRSLLFQPLGLSHSFYTTGEVMTGRFSVGHNRGQDGTLSIARSWKDTRGNNPGAGVASSASDLLRWSRFHLGDGRAHDSAPVLPVELLHRMKEPTVALRGSALGDAFGICWFLRDVNGGRTVGHGGSGNGQFAELLMVPERDFAVVALANAGPDGIPFNQKVVRWALQSFAGLIDRDPEPLSYDAARAREIIGAYENDAMDLNIRADGVRLTLEAGIKPHIRAASEKEMPPDYPPAAIGLLPGDGDEYILTAGALKGQRGFFTRSDSGNVVGVDLAGRFFSRAPDGASRLREESEPSSPA